MQLCQVLRKPRYTFLKGWLFASRLKSKPKAFWLPGTALTFPGDFSHKLRSFLIYSTLQWRFSRMSLRKHSPIPPWYMLIWGVSGHLWSVMNKTHPLLLQTKSQMLPSPANTSMNQMKCWEVSGTLSDTTGVFHLEGLRRFSSCQMV